MTTDGTTLQFPGEVPTHVTLTTSASSSTGFPTGVPTPAALFALDVTINGGETYSLPAPGRDPISIFLPDETPVLLSAASVVVGKISIDVPKNVDGPTHASGGGGGDGAGVSLTFSPPAANAPSSLFGGLESLVSAASDAADGITSIASEGQAFLESGSPEALGNLVDSIDSTLTSLQEIQSTITGIQQNLADELLGMVSKDYKEVVDTINTVRDVYDFAVSVKDTINEFQGAVGTIKKKVQNAWPDFRDHFDRHVKQLHEFADFRWRTDPPSHDEASYIIITRMGTDLKTFHNLTEHLDGGKGYAQAIPLTSYQNYYTRITPAQARKIEKLDFIHRVCWSNPFGLGLDTRYNRAVKNGNVALEEKHSTQLVRAEKLATGFEDSILDRNIWKRANPRPDSPSQLKLISSRQRLASPPTTDYQAHESLGEGQTVYVVDTGYDLELPDFTLQNEDKTRDITHAAVPNHVIRAELGDRLVEEPNEDDMTDYVGHGTGVAAVAGGHINGVASNADLHLVKSGAKVKVVIPTSESFDRHASFSHYTTLKTTRWALSEIMRHLDENQEKRWDKSVVNLSLYTPLKDVMKDPMDEPTDEPTEEEIENQEWIDAYEDFLVQARIRGVSVVIAVGNRDEDDPQTLRSSKHYVPQQNVLNNAAEMLVGAVHADGTLASLTRIPEPDDHAGIAAWAQGVDVRVPIPSNLRKENGPHTRLAEGTSYAAPAVAGLVAYFRGHPEFADKCKEPEAAKTFIYDNSFERVPGEKSLVNPHDPPHYEPPGKLPIVYNLYQGPPLKPANVHIDCPPDSGNVRRNVNGVSVCIPASNSTTTPSPTQPHHHSTSASACVPRSNSTRTSSLTHPHHHPASAPTQHVDLGDLTCGARADQGNPEYWMALDIGGGELPAGANDAANFYCTWMKNTKTYFTPGEINVDKRYHYNQFNADPILLNAHWTNDPGCPTLDFRLEGDDAYQYCMDRMGTILNKCDTESNGHFYWKQGGRFFRDCITWTIERDRWENGVPDESYRPPPTCTELSYCYDKCNGNMPDAGLSCLRHSGPGHCICSDVN